MEQLEKDKLYISFHRPKSFVGLLISAWTLGNYSHCEFIYNNQVYGTHILQGLKELPFKYLKNIEVYELDSKILAEDILEFFNANKGKKYDIQAILGSQFIWFLNSQDKDKYFCSEFCLNAIDYSLQFSLKYKGKYLYEKGYHKFNPVRLFKYMKENNLIGKRVI